jgi:hypothetical protein
MSPDDRLESWKEIAVFLRRGISTVQRWERTEGLPVRRLPHAKAGSIYAYRHEVDAWWRRRSAGPAGSEATPPEGDVVCRLIWGDREFALREGQNVLGRSSDAAVYLKQARVSRRHACITVVGDGATLEDLGSKNGTHVRGRQLESACTLEDRDEIRIGSVRMVFRSYSGGGSTETGSSA